MTFSVVADVGALRTLRHLHRAEDGRGRALQRLSSGLRINVASDDAAGLAISERLSSQLRGLSQAARNANDGVALLQTTEGAMNTGAGIVSRMRELAIQAANATLGDQERTFLHQEYEALRQELNRISDVTEFNGRKLLDGSASGIQLQIGVEDTNDDQISVAIGAMRSDNLGTGTDPAGLDGVNLTSIEGAQGALGVLDAAINDIGSARADLGSIQNRLQTTIANLESVQQNLSTANSRIRDADLAEDTSRLTSNAILAQASIAVLAQANQAPTLAVALLGG